MRLLHLGDAAYRVCAAARQPGGRARRRARGAVGQSVPLLRLPQDRRGGAVRRAASSVMSVGQRLPRTDAREKTDGRARYIADLERPGMLHAAILGSSAAHALI